MDRHSVIIVGGGPAGVAAALSIAQRCPHLMADMLLLESKAHPRPKLCGGGVTFHGEEQLERLGIVVDAPAFTVHRLEFRLNDKAFFVDYENVMRVYDRAEFDAALMRSVEAQGIRVHMDERLLDLKMVPDGVELTTSQGQYHTKILIGADGANSLVRRKLKLPGTLGVARLLRNMSPVDTATNTLWKEQTAVFDFSCVRRGVQGYMWDFPCYMDGLPYMNNGIFDSRIEPEPFDQRPHGHFKQTFLDGLRSREVGEIELEGHPVRWFNPAADFACPHILLTGDAAGVDPLFAEGISYAMEYGEIVAEMVEKAFQAQDFSFRYYKPMLLQHHLGKMLSRRRVFAQYLYKHRYPRFWQIFWNLAQIAPYPLQKRFAGFMALLPSS